jgi:hypothetical protein
MKIKIIYCWKKNCSGSGQLKTSEERDKEERSKIDDLRGTQ